MKLFFSTSLFFFFLPLPPFEKAKCLHLSLSGKWTFCFSHEKYFGFPCIGFKSQISESVTITLQFKNEYKLNAFGKGSSFCILVALIRKCVEH